MAAYVVYSKKNNTFVDKCQDRGKQFSSSKGSKLWKIKFMGGN